MKRICFACENNGGLKSRMSMHLGRCPYYTMVDVEGRDIQGVEVVENPYFNDHTPGVVPHFINSHKANVMIAGGMGPRAIEIFQSLGIEVATGVGGQVENILDAYFEGKVQGTSACPHDHAQHE
ncbi:MAG: NifB/NifX family molybdenum-iron cluster-binding protein [Syntrophales bacterium]